MRSVTRLVIPALALACAPAATGDPGACEAGAVRCAGPTAFERCRDGAWTAEGECADACSDGACAANACPDGARQECDAAGQVRICVPDVGGWTPYRPCPAGSTCADDACRARACEPDRRFCVGRNAMLCDRHGTAAELLEVCADGEVCANGVCFDACRVAGDQRGSHGCEFLAYDADNNDVNDPTQFDVVVASAEAALGATVHVDARVAGGEWTAVSVATVAPGEARAIPLACSIPVCEPGNVGPDRHPEDTTLARRLAFRVRSDVPIVAYQFNSTDYQGWSSSSGATTLMPTTTLGDDYRALTLPQTPPDNRSWVAVIAAQDDTVVTVTVAGATVAGDADGAPGAIPALVPGGSYQASLDAGDVLQLASAALADDLSGTRVEASRPVAVFAGNECANVTGGYCGGGFSENLGGDHIEEQMWPVTSWGRSFVAAHVHHVEQYALYRTTWRVVAAEDDTVVTFSGDGSLRGLPRGPVALDAGQVATVVVDGHSGNPGHFVIEADQAVQVAQFVHGQTAAIVAVPTEQFADRYAFLAPPFFADAMMVARPVGVPVLLDGSPLEAQWTAASADHEVGWLSGVADRAHVLESGGGLKAGAFGAQILGMDVNCSYGYLGGFRVEIINVPE